MFLFTASRRTLTDPFSPAEGADQTLVSLFLRKSWGIEIPFVCSSVISEGLLVSSMVFKRKFMSISSSSRGTTANSLLGTWYKPVKLLVGHLNFYVSHNFLEPVRFLSEFIHAIFADKLGHCQQKCMAGFSLQK